MAPSKINRDKHGAIIPRYFTEEQADVPDDTGYCIICGERKDGLIGRVPCTEPRLCEACGYDGVLDVVQLEALGRFKPSSKPRR